MQNDASLMLPVKRKEPISNTNFFKEILMDRECFMCLTPFKECLLPLKTCVKENNVNSKRKVPLRVLESLEILKYICILQRF